MTQINIRLPSLESMVFVKRLAAFRAFAVFNDAGAGAVRAKDTVIRIKFVARDAGGFGGINQRDAALQTIAALRRNRGPASGAGLSFDFFITVGTFQHKLSSFLKWLFEKTI